MDSHFDSFVLNPIYFEDRNYAVLGSSFMLRFYPGYLMFDSLTTAILSIPKPVLDLCIVSSGIFADNTGVRVSNVVIGESNPTLVEKIQKQSIRYTPQEIESDISQAITEIREDKRGH